MAEFQDERLPPAPSVYSSVSDISGQYPDTFCYRCSSEFDRQRAAIWHCVECSESFCKKCYPEHFRNKQENWNHTIKDMAGMNPFRNKNLKKQAPVKYLDTACTHCARDNKAVTAIRFCKECKANLCTTCLKWHNDSERYIGHTMKRVWEAEMETQEKCQKHPKEVISRYCKDHDTVCCIKCIHLDHRNCKFTEDIQKIEEDIQTNKTYLATREDINKAKMNTLRLIQARKDDMNRVKDERYNILVEIQTNRERLNEHLDCLVKKSKQELKVRFEKFMEEINQDIQQLEEMLPKLEIEANKLQTFEEDNESQQFIYLKQAEQITRQSNTLEQKVEISTGSEYLNYNLHINVIDTICDMKTLGDFSVFALSLSDTFEVKTKKDKNTCYITDSCLMSDGSLVLVDSTNNTVKKLDTSYKVTAECMLPGRPRAICSICSTGPTEVAIAFSGGTIQFASVTNQICLTRSWKIDGYCARLAYNNGELYVAVEISVKYMNIKSIGKVEVYNTSGQLLRSLVSDMEYLDFLDTYIGTCLRGRMIHIADSSLGLVTMDTTGHKLWEKTELKGICGLTATENGSLVVCCATRKSDITFLMIGRDGKTKRELLTQTFPEHPSSILYDTANLKLYVTFEMTNIIHVYNLTST